MTDWTRYITPELWDTALTWRGPIVALLALVVLLCLVVIGEVWGEE